MAGEEFGLPVSRLQAEQELETRLATLINSSPVEEVLWVPSNGLGKIATADLGIYALSQNEAAEVADWTPLFAKGRSVFAGQLGPYIRKVYESGERNNLLADALAAQPVLPEPVLSEEEMVTITEELATGFMGFDSLLILSGLLSKRELAILLGRLPEQGFLTSASKYNIKIAARKVENKLIEGAPATEDSEANRAFSDAVAQALATGEEQTYAADMWGPKAFMRKEGDKVAMVRRIGVGNFTAWLRAYESPDVWQELGFNHVPIEPILYFGFDAEHGEVDVRTVLLRSENFAKARQKLSPEAAKTLDEQKQRVRKGLDKCGVLHGHLHDDNLQVVQTENGPLTFVIDFDKALIKKDIHAK